MYIEAISQWSWNVDTYAGDGFDVKTSKHSNVAFFRLNTARTFCIDISRYDDSFYIQIDVLLYMCTRHVGIIVHVYASCRDYCTCVRAM